ncbi:hypothetical protein [Methylobacterium sp. CM6257]
MTGYGPALRPDLLDVNRVEGDCPKRRATNRPIMAAWPVRRLGPRLAQERGADDRIRRAAGDDRTEPLSFYEIEAVPQHGWIAHERAIVDIDWRPLFQVRLSLGGGRAGKTQEQGQYKPVLHDAVPVMLPKRPRVVGRVRDLAVPTSKFGQKFLKPLRPLCAAASSETD